MAPPSKAIVVMQGTVQLEYALFDTVLRAPVELHFRRTRLAALPWFWTNAACEPSYESATDVVTLAPLPVL